jgi:hypothetical protein
MYKLNKDAISGNISCVTKLDENLVISMHPDNTDYQAYLKWVADGNTPLPAENT